MQSFHCKKSDLPWGGLGYLLGTLPHLNTGRPSDFEPCSDLITFRGGETMARFHIRKKNAEFLGRKKKKNSVQVFPTEKHSSINKNIYLHTNTKKIKKNGKPTSPPPQSAG